MVFWDSVVLQPLIANMMGVSANSKRIGIELKTLGIHFFLAIKQATSSESFFYADFAVLLSYKNNMSIVYTGNSQKSCAVFDFVICG